MVPPHGAVHEAHICAVQLSFWKLPDSTHRAELLVQVQVRVSWFVPLHELPQATLQLL